MIFSKKPGGELPPRHIGEIFEGPGEKTGHDVVSDLKTLETKGGWVKDPIATVEDGDPRRHDDSGDVKDGTYKDEYKTSENVPDTGAGPEEQAIANENKGSQGYDNMNNSLTDNEIDEMKENFHGYPDRKYYPSGYEDAYPSGYKGMERERSTGGVIIKPQSGPGRISPKPEIINKHGGLTNSKYTNYKGRGTGGPADGKKPRDSSIDRTTIRGKDVEDLKKAM
ncbi:MAG: hypothetical protein ABIJ23_01635 [Candidatus Magasanikbacteria bacterium]